MELNLYQYRNAKLLLVNIILFIKKVSFKQMKRLIQFEFKSCIFIFLIVVCEKNLIVILRLFLS
jgi:hypothetical protein